MQLPDLNTYRRDFGEKGISYPLLPVPFSKGGLLSDLPAPEMERKGWPWDEETDATIYDPDNEWPKLTIVTPSFNQGQFIEETIRSVLLQNYPNLEYIIIDGGSTDNTRAILEKYDRWVSLHASDKDEGQGQAINMGFSMASGRYHAWLNSDDYYLKEVFYKVMVAFMSGGKDFIYGYGYSYHHREEQFELVRVLPLMDYFSRIPSLVQPSCFWNTAIHQPVWEQLQCAMDYELWLRLVKGRSRKLLKIPLSVANVHGAAKTSDPAMKAAWESDHQLICGQNAHGSVEDWNKRVFLRRIYSFIYRNWNRFFGCRSRQAAN